MATVDEQYRRPKTKLVCTLGPATDSPDTIRKLICAGMNVARFNLSHGNLETHDTRPFLPGLGFTIEPGVYLPSFGVRSEIDLHIGSDGLEITTPVQQEVVLIE